MNRLKCAQIMVLLCLMAISAVTGYSNHLAGGYLSYECLSEGTYEVTLHIFQDCFDDVVAPSQNIRVVPSCNFNFFSASLNLASDEVLTELCPSNVNDALCNGGSLPSYRLLTYTGIISIPFACESYRILYKLNYRTGTVNLASGLNSFYIHVELFPQAGVCNSSPLLAAADIIQSCVGNGDQVFMEPYDPEGDSLHFSFAPCLASDGGNSFGPIPYTLGFTPMQPMPGANLNEFTGLFQYEDAGAGKYAVALRMDQYDENDVILSSTIVDFIVIKEQCATAGLTLGQDELYNISLGAEQTGPRSLSICQGQYFCADYVFAIDDPNLQISSTHDFSNNLDDVSLTWSNENDSLRLTFCGTSPLLSADILLTLNIQDNHCPYVNSLITEIFLHVTEASSPQVFIENFGTELYMTMPTPGESYQWFENGIAIDGATASSLILSNQAGMDYYLIVTDTSGCIGTSNTISFPVSVNEFNMLDISLLPNPVKDMLQIHVDRSFDLPLHLTLFDIQGRSILETRLLVHESRIDLHWLAEGMYQLLLHRDGDAELRTSLIKE